MGTARDPSATVALVQMPFARTSSPSLGLSLLKASLATNGIGATVLYLNSIFADRLGIDEYVPMSDGTPQTTDLLGEWVFCEALWGTDRDLDESYRLMVMEGADAAHKKDIPRKALDQIWQTALRARAEVEPFIEFCVGEYDWGSYSIIGFTSVFQQHVASLALARALKERFPHLTIVFGGANCEGEMGEATLSNFPFVDAVCTGEGDRAFVDFVRSVITNTPARICGFLIRGINPSLDEACAPVDLNTLPYPDFDDFFFQFEASREAAQLVFETSRGCWWGQKNHCTFCGLNGNTMAFREKRGDRAIDEISHLLQKYGNYTRYMAATDNIIPYKYFEEFLPKLIELDMKIDIFYETKSNLKRSQLDLYKRAGLKHIQPGIESLDTKVLKLMKKGVTALQNIQLLVWCREYGVEPYWNYLVGFPGEEESSYSGKSSLIAKVRHLTPPQSVFQLRFDRFSPYFTTPSRFGVSSLEPYPSYSFIYHRVSRQEVARLAYYFVAEYSNKPRIETYTSELFDAVKYWQAEADSFLLTDIVQSGMTMVFDTRYPDSAKLIVLKGLYHYIFNQCRSICSLEQAAGHPDATNAANRELVSTIFKVLEEYGLILQEEGRFLTISVPLDTSYKPGAKALSHLKSLFVENEGEGDTKNVALTSKDSVEVLEA
jgi:ribosomal peptide maturation radical SAM protein 1